MVELLKPRTLTVVFVSLALSACGDFRIGEPATQQTMYTLEGIKLISPLITNRADPMAYEQSVYHLDENTRLLMRFEALSDYVDQIATGDSRKVELLIYPDREITQLPEALRVCPIAKNWMMLATWLEAHPFGTDGHWTRAGGDFHSFGCQEPEFDTGEDPEPALVFDLTRWFQDYPEGRQENNGWVVLAANPFSLHGDTSPHRSPRIRFQKYVNP